MNFSRILKFTCSGAILAAGIYAYADGEVTLTADGSKISWTDFVEALNNPPQVEGVIPANNAALTAWKNANDRLTTAKGNLTTKTTAYNAALTEQTEAKDALYGKAAELGENDEEIKPAVIGLIQKVADAEKAQSDAAEAVTTAKNNYTAANDEYNEAMGNQSDAQTRLNTLNSQLTAAKDRRDVLEANLKKNFDDPIAAKLAEITTNQKDSAFAEGEVARYTRLMNALVTTTYEETTPGWLTEEYNRAVAFQTAVNKCYEDWDGESEYPSDPDVYVYYQWVKASKIGTKMKLTLSFEEEHELTDDWKKATDAQFIALIDIQNITFTTLYLDLGSEYPDNNGIYPVEIYGGNSSNALTNAVSTLRTLWQTYKEKSDKPTETITNQALYDEYKNSKEEFEAKINGTKNDEGETVTVGYTQANVNLRNQIKQLRKDELSDPDYVELHGADGENGAGSVMYSINTLPGQITTVQEELDGYTDTINIYRATKTPVVDGEGGEDCKDAAGNTITYLKWLSNKQTEAEAAKATADQTLANLQKQESTAQTRYTNAQNAVKTAENAMDSAQSEVNSAQSALDNAQIAKDAAQEEADAKATADAMKKYNEIELNGSVINATEPIKKAYAGTIKGNGAIFNVKIAATEANTQTTLFDAFSGHVDDAAINGAFASNLANATFTDVARWDGTNGRIYSETGTHTEFNGNTLEDAFGAFGYALRDNQYFGVDFSTGDIVKTGEAPSKVFSLTTFDLPAGMDDENPVETQNYVQLAAQGSSDMVTRVNNESKPFAVMQNRFAQSATADVANLNLANVFYGKNNTCDNVKIVDREDFYCPETVQAKAINYGRKLKGGYNSVCLPFVLNKANIAGDILSICEYESVDFTAKKFWFKQNESNVPANTPVLIVREKDASEVDFNIEIGTTIAIAKTDKSQIVSAKAMNDDSHSYGTLKKAHVSTFEGMEYAGYIYGLNTQGEFIAAAQNATFPSFRMVIGTNQAINPKPQSNAPMCAPGNAYDVMGIGIHDERGYDITDQLITTGIETVTEATAPALEIVGGQGEISITSEANYGKVQIFTVDGRVAASANVIEGTTTVSLAHGLYIVMGQKVLVK